METDRNSIISLLLALLSLSLGRYLIYLRYCKIRLLVPHFKGWVPYWWGGNLRSSHCHLLFSCLSFFLSFFLSFIRSFVHSFIPSFIYSSFLYNNLHPFSPASRQYPPASQGLEFCLPPLPPPPPPPPSPPCCCPPPPSLRLP